MTAISSLRNLGPAMEQALQGASIPDAETLRDLGADVAYAQLLDHGHRPHFISYYVLHMALQGRPWNDCKGAEKDALRIAFDALKANRAPERAAQSELEAFLDKIGVTTKHLKG